MKNLIRAEEAGLFLLALYLFGSMDYPWWLFLALLFVPDLSMIGYLWNEKAGAILYNVIHFRGLAVGVYIAGTLAGIPQLALAGVIMLAHSSMDRVFEYGLKKFSGFKQTHLGELR